LKYAEYFKVNFLLSLADIDLSGQIPKREEIGYHGLFLLSNREDKTVPHHSQRLTLLLIVFGVLSGERTFLRVLTKPDPGTLDLPMDLLESA
jgi:hypothetical protein